MTNSQTPHILIVEDNPEISENIKQALSLKKYEVSIANTGTEALNVISKSKKYDLVLLDVMLPGVNGWEILIKLKSNPQTETWPVIMLTAIDDETSIANALYDGADDYVTKPFRIKTLLARIEALIRRSSKYVIKNSSLPEGFIPLTEREKDVLKCLTEGLSNNEIADKLTISRLTVEGHLKKIFEKLKVDNRTQAAIVGIKCNLI